MRRGSPDTPRDWGILRLLGGGVSCRLTGLAACYRFACPPRRPLAAAAIVEVAEAPVICETADEGRKDGIAFFRDHSGGS